MIAYTEIRHTLINERDILINEIEEEKGFSFKKLFKIIQLNGILNEIQ